MQISTRERDYLVDTLELRHCMECLNTSFTNPKITKVFHGKHTSLSLSLYIYIYIYIPYN